MLVQRFNVERVTRTGTAHYLSHVPGIGMEWTVNADDAYEFDDREEAETDAEAHGGEVFTFQRLMRRTDAESFTAHNSAARLERAYLEAAE